MFHYFFSIMSICQICSITKGLKWRASVYVSSPTLIWNLCIYGNKIVFIIQCQFGIINFVNLFYYPAYFLYYSWVPLYFLVLFINSTLLYRLIFTFIYNIFNKKFLIQQNKRTPNIPLINLNLYNFLKQANCFFIIFYFQEIIIFQSELNIQQKHSNLQTV